MNKRMFDGLDYQGRHEEASEIGNALDMSQGILNGLLISLALVSAIGLLAFWVWG